MKLKLILHSEHFYRRNSAVSRAKNRKWGGRKARRNSIPDLSSNETIELPFLRWFNSQQELRHYCCSLCPHVSVSKRAYHLKNFVIKSKNNIQVVAGTNYLNDEKSSIHNVKNIIVHENYSPSDSWKNDIALLEVVEPFSETKLISFINLPTSHDVINANDRAVISGWGRLWQNGATTKKLQRAQIYIADQTYCRNMYSKMNYNIHDSHICAYDPESPRGSCHDDSGGPLTVNGKLVGLVSWAKACALTDYPTVYTRVSEFKNWIRTHTEA
uniref:Peptidase S1 domain-containing protein n=1 Tax=Vespula pensylvanica TaxID=30213 RepID=A0A834P122_VESPE|nr:hypothetical protein H0235_009026 [Vespula pensylvanica]